MSNTSQYGIFNVLSRVIALACALFLVSAQAQVSADYTKVLLPPVALTANDIAVVVNDADPASVIIADYYAEARGIPLERVIHVRFAADRNWMSQAEFRSIKAQLDAKVPANVQAYALAWIKPYRVECMSITSAFALGFDTAYCAEGCKLTKASPYYNSDSVAPYRDHGMRPAIMLGASDLAGSKALIDRGVRSDNKWPQGTAYLMTTSDKARTIRSASYPRTRMVLAGAVPFQEITADVLENKKDVLFYFTGLAQVRKIESNRFVDGAIADHLTSAGGNLTDSTQMSAIAWIDGGATGSYGTALEPCNFPQKFPNITVLMGRYLSGETLIEAYWKSVAMPGQGVFVGEPLAKPFGGVRVVRSKGDLLVRTRSLRPGKYQLQASDSEEGSFRTVGQGGFGGYAPRELRITKAAERVYRLVRTSDQPAESNRAQSVMPDSARQVVQ